MACCEEKESRTLRNIPHAEQAADQSVAKQKGWLVFLFQECFGLFGLKRRQEHGRNTSPSRAPGFWFLCKDSTKKHSPKGRSARVRKRRRGGERRARVHVAEAHSRTNEESGSTRCHRPGSYTHEPLNTHSQPPWIHTSRSIAKSFTMFGMTSTDAVVSMWYWWHAGFPILTGWYA